MFLTFFLLYFHFLNCINHPLCWLLQRLCVFREEMGRIEWKSGSNFEIQLDGYEPIDHISTTSPCARVNLNCHILVFNTHKPWCSHRVTPLLYQSLLELWHFSNNQCFVCVRWVIFGRRCWSVWNLKRHLESKISAGSSSTNVTWCDHRRSAMPSASWCGIKNEKIAAQFPDVTSHVLFIIVFKSAQYGELKQCPVTLAAALFLFRGLLSVCSCNGPLLFAFFFA